MANRPFPSSRNPHFQNEANCTTFVVKMSLICTRIKKILLISMASHLAHFETEAFATGKWPIFSLAFCILINKDRHQILSSTVLVVATDTISLLSSLPSLADLPKEAHQCCLSATFSLQLLIEQARIWGTLENQNNRFKDLGCLMVDTVKRLANCVTAIIEVVIEGNCF